MLRYAVRITMIKTNTPGNKNTKKISVSLSGDQARALRQSIALNQITGLLPTPARSPKNASQEKKREKNNVV